MVPLASPLPAEAQGMTVAEFKKKWARYRGKESPGFRE
jgi:hypothetical protein